MSKFAAVLFGLFFAVAANAATHRIPSGTYEGKGVRVEVTAKQVNVTLGCTFGQFKNPKVDSTGEFAVRGTERTLMMVRNGGVPQPATLSGRLDGDRLDITISNDSIKSSFTAVLGANEPMAMCE